MVEKLKFLIIKKVTLTLSRHFRLNSELSGAIAKILPHAKSQLSVHGSFFNQFVTYIYIYIYSQGRLL